MPTCTEDERALLEAFLDTPNTDSRDLQTRVIIARLPAAVIAEFRAAQAQYEAARARLDEAQAPIDKAAGPRLSLRVVDALIRNGR